jgi:hypothetical protein
MITQQQADYLIQLPKHIIEENQVLERKTYAPRFPVDDRIYIVSKEDNEFTFFVEIWQSPKNHFKLTLYCQEDEASIGLLRVDFSGRHKNPEEATENVPAIFRPFVGKWLETSHIHYYIEGYKPLAWALPLNADYTFQIKEFTEVSEFTGIFRAFNKKINLLTSIDLNVQTQIL